MISSLSVCVVTQQFKEIISGPGLHANNLVRYLVKDGHQVTILAPEAQKAAFSTHYDFFGVASPRFARSQARWFSLSWRFRNALRLLENKKKFDLIHFTDAREALFCGSKSPRIGNVNDTYSAELFSPGYYRRHYDDWLIRWMYYLLVHKLEKRIYPRLDAVIANSRYTASVLAREYGLKAPQLRLCYKSVDADFFRQSLRRRLQQEAHPPRVLFVGGNMQRKGLPLLLRAAPAMLQRIPNIEFWIVGRDRAEKMLRQMGSQLGIDTHVHFLGWKSQAELVDLYAQADVFIMPSLVEAFGVAFLEAMAAGLPVIGAAVGGIPEIIEDGKNGRLIPPGDEGKLVETVVEMLSSPALQSQFREEGLKTVKQFSVERMMSETYKIYWDVLNFQFNSPGG